MFNSLRSCFSVRRVRVLVSFFLTLITPLLAFGQARDTATPFQSIRDESTLGAHSKNSGSSFVKGTKGALEGYVRDDAGKPVKGVFIRLDQGSYTTQGETDVVPIIIPHVVLGAVVFNDPNVVKVHTIQGHHTKTDKHGHFSFKYLTPGSYNFDAGPYKRNFTTGWGELVANDKLRHKYTFPGKGDVAVTGGVRVQHDVVLLRTTR